MDNEELVRALVDAKQAHINDLQQTIGLQIALSNRLLNALIPQTMPTPRPDEGGAE